MIKIMKIMNENIRVHQLNIDKFIANMTQQPEYALEWSQTIFDSTAIVYVSKRVGDWLSSCLPLDVVISELRKSVSYMSKHPARSTSITANLYKQSLLSAYAGILEEIEDVIRYDKKDESFEDKLAKDD